MRGALPLEPEPKNDDGPSARAGPGDECAIANDSPYGLQAYVLSADPERARGVAAQLAAGRVLINGLYHEPLAPFGGFKQSGLGREMGVFGLEAHMEPKTVLGRRRAA